jgi:prepilin-type N-terminal cleavage/methylation domain-containing protein
VRAPRAAGFTLLELVIALSLGALVIAALSSILTPLVRSEIYSARQQTVELNLAEVDRLVEDELRQASLVTAPAEAGLASGTLEGCDNAWQDGSEIVALDPSTPMRSFAFCAADGIVYYYAQPGCPISYRCGESPTASFRWGPSPSSSLAFERPSAASTLVTADLTASSLGAAAEIRTAAAFSAPAGGPR